MNKQPSCIVDVDSIIKFIVDNRRGKVFKGWNEEQLFFSVVMGSEQNLFFVVVEEETILGVVLLRKLKPFELHVNQILTIEKGIMGVMLEHFLVQWPATKYLTAKRHGRMVTYKMETLKRLILV